MPIPEMKQVASTNITHVGYHPDSSELHVRFGSGHYSYAGVPQELHQGMMEADSKGKFFHDHIKGKFPHTKVNLDGN